MQVEFIGETVVKRLTTRESQVPEAIAALRSEIGALSLLQGGPVPTLLGHGDDFLELALIPYPTLGRRLGRPSPKPFAEEWIEASFAALRTIHEKGIVHGDISINNVAIGDDAEVTFLDFGLSVWSQSPPRDGAFRGTLAYVAPEVAHGGIPTRASDAFSLAATLAHYIRGAPLRDGTEFAAVLLQAAEEPVDTTGLPERLVGALAFDPSLRQW